jgi:hypothetical protein
LEGRIFRMVFDSFWGWTWLSLTHSVDRWSFVQLNGRISRHNSVYWSDSNPHEVIQEELNVPGLTVWAGIWSGGIVGPYFFYGTVSGGSYPEMLHEVVLTELYNCPLYDNTEIIWQQDGAPPHYSLRVREFLNNSFLVWFGRAWYCCLPAPPPPPPRLHHVMSYYLIFWCGS